MLGGVLLVGADGAVRRWGLVDAVKVLVEGDMSP